MNQSYLGRLEILKSVNWLLLRGINVGEPIEGDVNTSICVCQKEFADLCTSELKHWCF